MRTLPKLAAIFALATIPLEAQLAPAQQWVQTIGGSGSNQVVAAATDASGNLYIAGNTSSTDFPVTAAAQPNPGGSTLFRIDTASRAAQKLYPAGLSAPASLTADPRNPAVLYAPQQNAIWRSADGGNTWASLPAFPDNVAVYSVAVDPFDSSTLYAATSTQGVFKSTDTGLTWTAINIGIPPQRDGFVPVFRVWTDPKVPKVLFAAAVNTGFLRSADGGATWTLVIKDNFVPFTLAFDPFSSGTLYLAMRIQIGNSIQVAKSTDDGKTFTPQAALPDGSSPNVLVADPAHAAVLYAGSFSGIYQSTDAGVTWTKKATGQCTVMAADPRSSVVYANISNYGIVRSTDGFTTSLPIGPSASSLLQLVVAGPSVFVVARPSTDAFVVKLDPDGNVVYSTYFGGSARDSAAAIALGTDGSVYVAGTTDSIDLPTTVGAYARAIDPAHPGSSFVFKLNPDGSLAWSTYFADSNTTVASIAVDSAGNPHIGGSSNGKLPTTAGAYQTQFQQTLFCTGFIGCFPGPSSAFVTKLNAGASDLIYSTYVSNDPRNATVQNAQALVLDAHGNAYFGGRQNVVLLSADGSAVLGSNVQPSVNIAAVALDSAGNLYATGSAGNSAPFPATAGAFQTAPQPATPRLPAQPLAGGGSDAFVMKWDAGLTLQAATLLGGELFDAAESIAVDPSGNVILSGETDSRAFPTRAPFQTAFSPRSGFVAVLDSNLSHLLFSTYLGDERPFDAHAAVPDSNGNILIAGSTLTASSLFVGGDPGLSFSVGSLILANKIVLAPAPTPRLDSIVNFASRMAAALAPGEAIAATGAGFGSDTQLLLDGAPLPLLSVIPTVLVAVMPDDAKTSGTFSVQVSNSGSLSNTVFIPAAPASPGIYSVDGSGFGQGYILNSDGTPNSAANPAAPGSAITIFATGAGQFNLDGAFAVAALAPSVFIDGIYANGIAAQVTPVDGLPGGVYQLSVFVPDPSKLVDANPNFANFKFPPQVGVKLVFGPVHPLNSDNSAMISQLGLVLNVKQ